MAYDPLARGPLPVGVATVTLVDPTRGDRAVPTEVWYPATDRFADQDIGKDTRDHFELLPGIAGGWQLAVRDATPRDGSFALVVFSHGFGAHRRQSTFFTTHLASHGYVVLAPDHTGNTVSDMMAAATGNGAPSPSTYLTDRPADVSMCIDRALAGDIEPVAGRVDASRVGMSGHSFGGWTTLAATGRDKRIRAALPLAPAGGSSSVSDAGALRDALTFDWERDVPTLVIAAELDSVLPLEHMRSIYDPIRSPKRFVVLNDADHMHFCDRVERVHEMFRLMPTTPGVPRAREMKPIGQLCPGQHGLDAVTMLGLAHFDAHLRDRGEAAAFLDRRWQDALTDRGVSFSTW